MASNGAPMLALPSSYVPGSFSVRQYSEHVDALPYIDALTAQEKKEVEQLIHEECERGGKKPSDYLALLPPMPSSRFEGHPLLAVEYERVKQQQPMPPLDVSRFRLEQPAQSKKNDPHAWTACVNNAHSQLEHQQNRILNLELLLKYGDSTWKAQTQTNESILKQLESELAATKKAITALNQERKLSHTAAGSELRKQQAEYLALVQKNLEIETACDALRQEVYELESQVAGSNPQQNGAAAGQGEQQNGDVDMAAGDQGQADANGDAQVSGDREDTSQEKSATAMDAD